MGFFSADEKRARTGESKRALQLGMLQSLASQSFSSVRKTQGTVPNAENRPLCSVLLLYDDLHLGVAGHRDIRRVHGPERQQESVAALGIHKTGNLV